jgi:acetyl esterase/lipase
MLIQVGGYEALLGDSERLEANARKAGVDVTLQVFPEMQHVFQLMAGKAPEADEAIDKIVAWAKPSLGL